MFSPKTMVEGFASLASRASRRTGVEASAGSDDGNPDLAPTLPDQDLIDRLGGLVTIHDASGTVVRFGGDDAAQFAAEVAAPQGRGFLDRIHVTDRLEFLRVLDRLRQGERRASVELRMILKAGSGEQFTAVATDLSAEHAADGTLLYVLAQSRRIDDLLVLRREREAMCEKAASADAEKTRFLAAVSHEMRTPLNAIIGFSEILSREYFGELTDPRQRDYVDLIHQSGEHLLSLVNTMLDMSKIETGRYRLSGDTIDIGATIEECRAMLALQAEKNGVVLTTRPARGIGSFCADRRAVKQILINLIGNAIKFTEAGGVVTVDADKRDGQLVLTVGDTGIGMDETVIDRLGQPFMQADDSYEKRHQGTGLGLCLVKGLVALHSGRFCVKSTPGEGTVVTVSLPADGAGIAEMEVEEQRPVDFPPRLKPLENRSGGAGTETENDAKAKTA